ncbi:MAG: hypothetical protein A2Z81_06205 [Omnitrophica WOR_2 bacterium GWA2_45_18]|nr:MAG: hypothetical protein A2Z81_06205 [Omnitrophica WOR_2 bacterium GWA2_45_18]
MQRSEKRAFDMRLLPPIDKGGELLCRARLNKMFFYGTLASKSCLRRIGFFAVLFVLVFVSRYVSADPVTVFKQANEAYTGGNYPEAIRLYEEIVRNGYESGELYFNLGNSYYKAGQAGKTVLNYERAKRLIPRDSDLISNYEYVVSQIKNYVAGDSRPFLSRLPRQYKDYLSLDEMTYLLLVLWFLAGTLGLWTFTRKWPKDRALLLLIPLGLFFVFHVFVFSLKLNEQQHAAILIQEAQAKYEPIPEATTYFALSEGSKVRVVEKAGLWFKIKRPDGKLGWIEAEAVEQIVQEP